MTGTPRIASLDGLRAVSIALVLAGHSIAYSNIATVGDVANLGVRVFFVISGLLITSLLLREHAKQGSISLGRFFARRAIRILPPLLAFLVAVAIAERAEWIPAISTRSWAQALTYTINYVPAPARPASLGHLWSLAVEEQFYLLWPAVLVVLGIRRGLRGAWAVLVIVPLVRFLTWRYMPSHRDGIKWEFQTVCDALATGCVIAGIREQLWSNETWRRIMQSRWPLLLIPAVLALNWYIVGRPQAGYLFGITALNVCIGALIEYCVRNADTAGGRLLNAPVITTVGLLSYSMYLWQQLFFVHHPLSVVQHFPTNLCVTLAFAAFSYLALERPLVRWRQRLSRG